MEPNDLGMTLSEYGRQNNLTDEELVKFAQERWGMDEEDILLMLAIERGETDGDIVQGNEE